LVRLVGLLRYLARDELERLPSFPAIKSADPETIDSISRQLMTDRYELAVALNILTPVRSNPAAVNSTCLCLIGLSRFGEAKKLIESSRHLKYPPQLLMAFNFAMAEWGESSTVPTALMQTVVDLSSETSNPSPNFFQCLGVAYWA